MTRSGPVSNSTRRAFLEQSGSVVAGAALVGGLARTVHAAEDNTIRLALLGCGGRGSGAVRDALSVKNQGPVKLYAAADLLENKIAQSLKSLSKEFAPQIDVPADRQFVGWDGYRKAIDILRPGDVAMCTTRAYIRPAHVEYAIQKGVNVFFEKPFASDPAGLHRLLRSEELSQKKGLKIMAGLQCRHSPARQALIQQIRDGVLGDITVIRANRLGGTGWLGNQGPQANDLMAQLQFGRVQLYWVGSGHMVDYLIHQIDECCWIKDAWPVEAVGFGGRVPGSKDCGQNLDVYSIEYTFADGTKAFCGFRRINKTRNDFATYLHGTKCAAQFSGNVHAATVHRFKNQQIDKDNIAWTPEKDAVSPWQYEWNDFIESIRKDRPHNELKRAVYSDLTTLMGRAACHTGQTVTWDEMMKSRFQFCDVDALGPNSPGPAKADENGQFPVPVPGSWTEV